MLFWASKNVISGLHKLNPLLSGSESSPDPLIPFVDGSYACFSTDYVTPGIMPLFYLILLPAGSSDMHPGRNKMPKD